MPSRSRKSLKSSTKYPVPSTKTPQEVKPPKWWNVKKKGELAEKIFTVKAEALGIALSQPLGDNQPFDFMATTGLGTFRVQVKSAWKLHDNRYFALIQPRRLNPYSGFDVVVVYIAPLDAWYVIPASAIKSRWLKFFPHIAKSKARYEKYREGWRTLTGDARDDTYRVGLEIHAGRSS